VSILKDILINYMKRFTEIPDSELTSIAEDVDLQSFKKGTILLHQGDIPEKCYFVLKGCIRQYSVDEEGRENTFNFYTEEQFIAIFNHHSEDKTSRYSLGCLEDCVLVVGELSPDQGAYDANPAMEAMIRKMIEANVGEVNDSFARFVASKPEDRFKALLQNRPDLIDRVPQHQLASYLGITPESLSRIKKRF
jgi:CRP-like cAMP-binding protein